MALSEELVSALVKALKTDENTKDETTVYGTIKTQEGLKYVQIDGSNLLTPIATTTDIEDGERVTVMIKNHTATVTGNISSPAARTDDLQKAVLTADEINNKISEFEIAIAYRVTTEDLVAVNAIIESLRVKNAEFVNLESIDAEIETLQSKFANLTYVTADEVNSLNADIENLRAMFGSFADISTEELEAVNADINTLRSYTADFTYVSADVIHAIKASIDELDVGNLDARYANIDFSNIGSAAIETFFSTSGLIENVVVGDGTITGNLVGVTIKGDVIEGNTVVADKLVIKGEDGLFYKLNTDGVATEAEQTDQNSLDGSVITAKSITATKISVDDLVAFGATIGGFHMSRNSLYSGVKESVDNSTSGVYLGSDGQVAFGNSDNYLKFYAVYTYYEVLYDETEGVYSRSDNTIDAIVGVMVEDTFTADGYQVYSETSDGGTVSYFCRVPTDYKLSISADSILFGSNSKYSMEDVKRLTDHVHIGTYEDPESGEVVPCVELSEEDSSFKMRLTNKNATFVDGINDSTVIDSDGIETENLRVKNDIRHYDYIWRRRSNGNLGLMWMEVTD